VILVDANLLIYAHVSSTEQHPRARAWLDARLNGNAPVGLPWPSLLAFLRLVTNPRVFARPEPVEAAWHQVTRWLAAPVAWVPSPSAQHAEVLGELMTATGARGNLVPDAHLAALAIEHGLILCSTDGDFARFPGLAWRNPLAAGTTE
jgi:toxin-antitoxin system PIN domain toxin